ncbi:MAG TPA: MBL fold metallo-hydrolase [Vicinamibacteria bacterium]|nr:MBL fold metallo-hydrolase [Vicinamibacteria bacterium]
MRSGAALALLAGLVASPAFAAGEPAARAVKVTVLSTMLADTDGMGEWGFAALVEVDGYRLLFDTGARPETVLRNAEELKVDLRGIADVVLSHNHDDHTGGLLTLRRALGAASAETLSRAHVAPGILLPRSGGGGTNRMMALRDAYEESGARLVEHVKAESIAPGVWLTGPVPRRHPERNYPAGSRIVTADGAMEDTIPEDQSLVVRAGEGLVVVTGCGHAGIGNILAQARAIVPDVPVRAVVGGLHLLDADEKTLAWTADRMREAGMTHLLGAHCTGIEAVYRLRSLLGLDRRSAVVGAVGSSYSSASGIDPRWLAR